MRKLLGLLFCARFGSANLAPGATETDPDTLANSTGDLTSNNSRPMLG